MRDAVPSIARLPGVLVPISLLADKKFGGKRQGDCLAGDLIIRDGFCCKDLSPLSCFSNRLCVRWRAQRTAEMGRVRA